MTRTILIIDDETNMRWVLGRALEQAGYTAHTAESGAEGLALLAREPIELVLLDLKLKGEDGLTVLRRLRERQPDLVVMLLTAYGTVSNAVEAMQLGAADFLKKPFDVEEVTFKVARALERRALQQEVARLSLQQRAVPAFDTLTGVSPMWQEVVHQARLIAPSSYDALLIGEPGTGRATLGRAMHAASLRAEAPLIEVDLRTFGDPRAALLDPTGVWAQAGAGTIIIRGLAVATAAHETLGEQLAARPSLSGPRVFVVVTDDEAAALPGQLQAHVVSRLRVPPLRERAEDVALFVRAAAGHHVITSRAMQLLEQYAWPRNVPEVRSVIVRALQQAGDDPIDIDHLPSGIAAARHAASDTSIQLPPTGVHLEEVEQQLIRQALEQARGNKSRAAELLGLTRHTLLYRMEKYGITTPERD